MSKFFHRFVFFAGSLFTGFVFSVTASYDIQDLPQLTQQEQHAKVVKRVSDLYSRSHYNFIPLNDDLSQKVFDRYIEQLDYNKQIFLQSDIEELKNYQFTLDESLKSGGVSPAYSIYQLSLTRRYERYAYALSLLDTEIKFDTQDSYQFDRSKEEWFKTLDELNKAWQQKVKSDALSLKLTGKEWPEIKDRLSKRYNSAIKHLVQTESEDVFQTFMNAYSHMIEPHTSYLSPRNAKRFKMEMNLSLEGIGAVLQLEDDYTVVRSLVPGGPAERSNLISKDDKIVGVGQDGEKIVDIIGWRLDDIVDLIKGPKGTKVQLQLQSGKAGDTTRVVVIVREKIHLEDREAKSSVEIIDGKKIGVITIPSFYVNLSDDIDKELTTLKEQDVEGVIIDLRNNGGGSLAEATLSTGLFIGKGPVVQVRDSRNKIEVHRDVNEVVSYDGPLTVLVNRYSASASEIFAAALQDYGRAIIIGEQTFGKGTVQQHRRISRFYDDDADVIGSVQYTIAKFYRIDGGSTQHKGVIPDILFPTAIAPEDTGESLEKNALPWDNIKSADYEKFDNLKSDINKLTKEHNKRIKEEVEFTYLNEDIKEYKAEINDTSITLVEAERIKLREEKDQQLLIRNNERLKRAGLEEVKSLDDLPDDFEPIDAFLLEAAAITLDYSKM
jgi:carboxyl-terminal processing protease